MYIGELLLGTEMEMYYFGTHPDVTAWVMVHGYNPDDYSKVHVPGEEESINDGEASIYDAVQIEEIEDDSGSGDESEAEEVSKHEQDTVAGDVTEDYSNEETGDDDSESGRESGSD